jgi:DNA-binding response OmpR family regulator
VEKILAARRVDVLMAPRSSAALRMCEEWPPDLLIVDVATRTATSLPSECLGSSPARPGLLITGHYKDVPSSSKLPQVRSLKKPFFPSDLIARLRELLPGA